MRRRACIHNNNATIVSSTLPAFTLFPLLLVIYYNMESTPPHSPSRVDRPLTLPSTQSSAQSQDSLEQFHRVQVASSRRAQIAMYNAKHHPGSVSSDTVERAVGKSVKHTKQSGQKHVCIRLLLFV